MRKKRSVTERVEKLLALAQGKRRSLIVLQDDPDPDAIGSAVGLKHLLRRAVNMRCTIAHGGTVGRAENRALVEFLNLKLETLKEVDPAAFDLIALVDTQPGSGNNGWDIEHRIPDIVIDHHPRQPELRKVPYAHVDTRYGATATMVTEYLYHRDIEPTRKIATALVYGIRTDTADLTREASAADRDAMLFLFPLHLPEVIARIASEKVPRQYFRDFRRALEQATIYGPVVFANLNKVQNPDMVGEIADFLLRLEEMWVVLVVGVFEDELVLSCRVEDDARARGSSVIEVGNEKVRIVPEQLDAGQIMKAVVEEVGAGGGHASMSGGRIPLGKRRPKKDVEKVVSGCESRFLGVFGLKRRAKRDLT